MLKAKKNETCVKEKVTVKTSVHINMARFNLDAKMTSFSGFAPGEDHIAVCVESKNNKPPLVRIHSECLTGDLFGSTRCDCGNQLAEAAYKMKQEGGIILYLRQEGRGIGLNAKLDAYILQDQGFDTFSANRMLGFQEDARDFSVAVKMLKALSINEIRLLTNNPVKATSLQKDGINISEVISTKVYMNKDNLKYLLSKKDLGKHNICI